MTYMNFITLFCQFVLVGTSPCQDVHEYHITECLSRDVKVFFVLCSNPRAYNRFVCFSLGILLTQAPSKVGPPPSSPASHFLVRLPPFFPCISIIDTGTDSDESSARLPAVSIVCLIHSISPRLFLCSRWGEMGQFSLSAPNLIWLSSGAASVFAWIFFYFSTDIIHHLL